MDFVFIATAVTFKNCKRCIQVMNHINPPKLFLLRTQCDRFSNEAEFQSARQKDQQLLLEWGIYREVLYVSARMPDTYRDNARFKRLLRGENA